MDKLLKKKKEEDEQQRLQEALEEYQQTFEDGSGKHVPKTFIRGDIVNANKSMGSLPAVYKPVPIQNKPLPMPPQSIEKAKKIAEETARKIMQEASQNKNKIPLNRPPKPDAKKVVQSKRMTNLEIFKEELKQAQAMRQRLRQQLQEKLGADNEPINRIAPPLDNPYLTSGVSEFEDDPSKTNLYVCNMALDPNASEKGNDDGDDLGGDPLDEDIDGVPLDNDFDDGDDLDGEPLDEDIDGVPLDNDFDSGN